MIQKLLCFECIQLKSELVPFRNFCSVASNWTYIRVYGKSNFWKGISCLRNKAVARLSKRIYLARTSSLSLRLKCSGFAWSTSVRFKSKSDCFRYFRAEFVDNHRFVWIINIVFSIENYWDALNSLNAANAHRFPFIGEWMRIFRTSIQ